MPIVEVLTHFWAHFCLPPCFVTSFLLMESKVLLLNDICCPVLMSDLYALLQNQLNGIFSMSKGVALQ